MTAPAATERVARYRVEFDRIGRTHNPPALEVEAGNADELAEHVYNHARRYLLSSDVEVEVDLAELTVQIYAGFRNGGTGTITPFFPERRTGGAA